MSHVLQHLNSSECEIDRQKFTTSGAMEKYIDDEVLPYWESGDRIICDGAVREVFNDYQCEDE